MKPRGDANRDVEGKIDYTFIHNKKCELIEYLVLRDTLITEQMEHDIDKFLHDIAYNEVSQQYTPKQDTGFEIVRECNYEWHSASKYERMNFCFCPQCGGIDTRCKITEPLTVEGMKEHYIQMYQEIEVLIEYLIDLKKNELMHQFDWKNVKEGLNEALTYKGGRVRRKV